MNRSGYLVLLAVMALAGCARETVDTNVAIMPNIDPERVFYVCRDVVDQRFDILFAHPDEGRIFTDYRIAPTIIEPWSTDAGNVYQAIEETLHLVRRKVEVDIKKEGDDTILKVEVSRERQGYLPPIPTAASSYNIFDPGFRVKTYSLGMPGERTWVSLGRDMQMEQKFLKEILKRLGARSKPSPPSKEKEKEAP